MSARTTCSIPPPEPNWVHPGTTTISNAAQATNVAKCEVVQGSILIDPAYEGALNLNGLQEVTETISIHDAHMLTAISATDLQKVELLQLKNVPLLESLELPKLKNAGFFDWAATGENFQQPVLPLLEFVNWFWLENTALRSLDWLAVDNVQLLSIVGNDYLSNITLPSLTSGSLNINGNGLGRAVIDLPNLRTGSLLVSECSSLSLPVLTACTQEGSVQVVNCTMETVSLPSLQSCSFLTILDNPNVKSISAPELQSIVIPSRMASHIVGIDIGRNEVLDQIISFPALTTLTGGSFNGSFAGVYMPALTDEIRLLHFNSTKNISTTCSYFQSISGPDSVVKGPLTCFSDDQHGDDHHHKGVGQLLGGMFLLVLVFAVSIGGAYILRKKYKTRKVSRQNKTENETQKDNEEESLLHKKSAPRPTLRELWWVGFRSALGSLRL